MVSAFAGGDPDAGKQKASLMCQACHGVDGNSQGVLIKGDPAIPNLAGQNEKYLIAQLKAFKKSKEGGRNTDQSIQMYGMAAALSDQDLENIAAYYAAQEVKVGVTQDENLEKGEAIYRGGNLDTGLAACIACHGPAGQGNPAAGFPAVSGQHASYSYAQLKAFHNDTRETDLNSMMRGLVRKMSDEEMRAVADYMQGLH